jgi:ribose 5-phosphate isomerase RpiB
MRIAIGADHAGFTFKNNLRGALRAAGHEVADLGTDSAASTEQADYARKIARRVVSGNSLTVEGSRQRRRAQKIAAMETMAETL